MFDETIFVYALTTRPEDTKRYMNVFDPSWLQTVEYQPIVKEIFEFTKKHTIPPSCEVLHKLFRERDDDSYRLRLSSAINKIQQSKPDCSLVLHTLDKANDAAITNSFESLSSNPHIERGLFEKDGPLIIKTVYDWLTNFYQLEEDETLNIKDAIEGLMKKYGSGHARVRTPTGIKPIDEWTANGLFPGNLGIIVAPTGHGKSTLLLNMAYNMANIKHRNVWFITNELTMDEQTERFLSRIQNMPVSEIQDNPTIAYRGLESEWDLGLDQRLILTSVNREISADDLESLLLRMSQLNGFMPSVIVLDFMERMKPALSGYRRDKEWQWMGAIAKDLIRLAKKHNLLVWTAGQLNREGLAAEQVKAEMAAGSTRHLNEAAAVVGMRQKSGDPKADPEYEPERLMEFWSLKQRHSRLAFNSMSLVVHLDRMIITEEEYAPDETYEIERNEDRGVGSTSSKPVQKTRPVDKRLRNKTSNP